MTPDLEDHDALYRVLSARDPRADGRFVYAVVTTGVYCRPTCGARLPLRKNVRFHRSAAEAERAGFRACRRCRPAEPSPDGEQAKLIGAARARLASADGAVTLAELAADAGISRFHFHRLFKRHAGMTPRAYAAACRLQRFGNTLRAGAPVTTAIYEAGYSSSGRAYEANALGMTPTQMRRGGAGVEVRVVARRCSLGQVLVAGTSRGICAVSIGESRTGLEAELRARFPEARVLPADAGMTALAATVVALLDGAAVPEDVPLDLVGTAFQQKVWRALRQIPRGTTITYTELARRIGAPKAVRAVGSACAANTLAVLVPCHRVVREDGGLGGYRWGLARKKALLMREKAVSAAPRAKRR